MVTLSPLAPRHFPDLPDINGLSLAVAKSGMKYKDRLDFMMILADQDTEFAAVFTNSKTASSAVRISQQVIASGKMRAIITNAGNANAFTGKAGEQAIATYLSAFSSCFDLPIHSFALASTGVIGQPLDGHILAKQAEIMAQSLGKTSWYEAAQAICTTDTYPKGVTKQITIEGKIVTFNGIAKGSGMIAPDMATMLAYIGTDACLSKACLQALLDKAVQTSFNAITVDSDTSTSDSLYVMATQKAGHTQITDPNSQSAQIIFTALEEIMIALAHLIVRDGEGATKFITITVKQAIDDFDAKQIAFSIGNSPLVKTAIAGADANWGRIVMAVGKSGASVDRDKLTIWIDDHLIASNGEACVEFDEAVISDHMNGDEINITVDIGLGNGYARIWTCDLTHEYISINADYRS